MIRILAARMCELEKSIQSPTMRLLEGYTGAEVDLRCKYKENNTKSD